MTNSLTMILRKIIIIIKMVQKIITISKNKMIKIYKSFKNNKNQCNKCKHNIIIRINQMIKIYLKIIKMIF